MFRSTNWTLFWERNSFTLPQNIQPGWLNTTTDFDIFAPSSVYEIDIGAGTMLEKFRERQGFRNRFELANVMDAIRQAG